MFKKFHYPFNLDMVDRSQGCLLGQFSGDSLGALVEFKSPLMISNLYPNGVRNMEDGGTWNTIAGQLTDDSEMALMLTYSLLEEKKYRVKDAKKLYRYWLNSNPFDCGLTTQKGLLGTPDKESQANGALMRVSPLGIFGARFNLENVFKWAKKDATITHPHHITQEINMLFAGALSESIRHKQEPLEIFQKIKEWASQKKVDKLILRAIDQAAESAPLNYVQKQGWVLISFQNALWQLLHAKNIEEALVNTISHGGDTDTNAAICGAFLGAVYGRKCIPKHWIETLLKCQPDSLTYRSRPEVFWPTKVLELAENLLFQDEK